MEVSLRSNNLPESVIVCGHAEETSCVTFYIWPLRLVVRTRGFHPCNSSSILLVAIKCFNAVVDGYFNFSCREKYWIWWCVPLTVFVFLKTFLSGSVG